MVKFSTKSKGEAPAISTASLPDVIFMLLFFFMVSSTIKDTSLKVAVNTPYATELKKLEKKSLVSFIYIGKPLNTEKFGTAPRIQLNDAFASIDKIKEFITSEREKLRREEDKAKMSVSIKADGDVDMGIITDVKQALRRANALKINYSAKSGSKETIFSNLK